MAGGAGGQQPPATSVRSGAGGPDNAGGRRAAGPTTTAEDVDAAAGAASNGSGRNNNSGPPTTAGARTPEWTGLAPHPSLMIQPPHQQHAAAVAATSAFGHGVDLTRYVDTTPQSPNYANIQHSYLSSWLLKPPSRTHFRSFGFFQT
jgi:hypothetical protein